MQALGRGVWRQCAFLWCRALGFEACSSCSPVAGNPTGLGEGQPVLRPRSARLRQAPSPPLPQAALRVTHCRLLRWPLTAKSTSSLLTPSSGKGAPRSHLTELALVTAESVQAKRPERWRPCQTSLGAGPSTCSGTLSPASHSGKPCTALGKMRAGMEAARRAHQETEGQRERWPQSRGFAQQVL